MLSSSEQRLNATVVCGCALSRASVKAGRIGGRSFVPHPEHQEAPRGFFTMQMEPLGLSSPLSVQVEFHLAPMRRPTKDSVTVSSGGCGIRGAQTVAPAQ
jgi:hypothetical protein